MNNVFILILFSMIILLIYVYFKINKRLIAKEKEQIDLLMSIQNQNDSDIVIEKEIE